MRKTIILVCTAMLFALGLCADGMGLFFDFEDADQLESFHQVFPEDHEVWQIEDGWLTVSESGGLHLREEKFADVAIEFDLRTGTGSGYAAVQLRRQSPEDCLEHTGYIICFQSDTAQYMQISHGSGATPVAIKYQLFSGQTHARIEVRGNRIAVFMDGKEVNAYTDSKDNYSDGYIALWLSGAMKTQFDNLRIERL